MEEALLHLIWDKQLFNHKPLQTVDGKSVTVIHSGFRHQDAGPDFRQAVIKIGDITWAGNVEIHVKGSDWLRHGHSTDKKYDSVILHVVYVNDYELMHNQDELVATLELKPYVSAETIASYNRLEGSLERIPCRDDLEKITGLQMTECLSAEAVDRLIERQHKILAVVSECAEDWNEAFYRLLCINFGFKTNATPFELLSRSLPYKILQRHLNTRLQINALLFGQAGFLEEEIDDDYYKMLRAEYDYLRYKYRLSSIDVNCWNLLRLRPQNFPCLRLAQLGELLFLCPDMFNRLVQQPQVSESLFTDIIPHSYWERHLHFGKVSRQHATALGKHAVNLIYINTIVPIMFSYGTFMGNELLQEKAINRLENIDFENNHITRQFRAAGFPDDNALYSQALLQIHNAHCRDRQCLQCRIGRLLVGR